MGTTAQINLLNLFQTVFVKDFSTFHKIQENEEQIVKDLLNLVYYYLEQEAQCQKVRAELLKTSESVDWGEIEDERKKELIQLVLNACKLIRQFIQNCVPTSSISGYTFNLYKLKM